jgi:hypothetical protein
MIIPIINLSSASSKRSKISPGWLSSMPCQLEQQCGDQHFYFIVILFKNKCEEIKKCTKIIISHGAGTTAIILIWLSRLRSSIRLVLNFLVRPCVLSCGSRFVLG